MATQKVSLNLKIDPKAKELIEEQAKKHGVTITRYVTYAALFYMGSANHHINLINSPDDED